MMKTMSKEESFNISGKINLTNNSKHKKISSENQRKTLKVSPQTKTEIEELKRELKMGFNYEVIQFLIDNYVHDHLNLQQQKRFHENSSF